jgi:hypothetical protein
MDEPFRFPSLIKMRRSFAVRLGFGVALLLAIQVLGQSPYPQFPSTNSGRNGQNFPDSNSPFGHDSNSPEKKRMQMLNAERQKTLISDTEKLVKLAKQLNDEMADTGSGEMTGQQLHKVEEIAKLAKSIKEKMSYSVGGYPSVNPPLTMEPGIQ